jgi:hypothetical protein
MIAEREEVGDELLGEGGYGEDKNLSLDVENRLSQNSGKKKGGTGWKYQLPVLSVAGLIGKMIEGHGKKVD